MRKRNSMTFGKLGQPRKHGAVVASVAPTGQSFTSSPYLYPAVPDSSQRGARPQNVDAPIWAQIPQTRQRAMLQDARAIYVGSGAVKGACDKVADYAVGWAWMPRYTGTDERFRAIAEKVVHGWMKACDVRGGQYDWHVGLRTACVSIDRDGDCFAVLTTDPDSGGPRIQWIEADRIGQPMSSLRARTWSLVPDTAETKGYVGMKSACGIVFDDMMRPVAYNVMPYDMGVSVPYVWNLVPADSVVWFFDPLWFSQARGTPSLSHGILDWYDLNETVAAEKIAAKVASALALIETNETGRRNLGAEALGGVNIPTAGRPGLETQTFERGLIRYIKPTGKIETLQNNRPSTGWLGLMEHLTRSAFAGMGLPMEFVWDSSKIGGAGVRSMVGQVTRAIERRQRVLYRPALQCLLYAVASYIKRGDIPAAVDWYEWDFSLPPLYSVDMGRDSQNRREDFAVGVRSMSAILAEESINIRDHLNTRAQDYLVAKQISDEKGVPMQWLMNPSATFGMTSDANIETASPSVGPTVPDPSAPTA